MSFRIISRIHLLTSGGFCPLRGLSVVQTAVHQLVALEASGSPPSGPSRIFFYVSTPPHGTVRVSTFVQRSFCIALGFTHIVSCWGDWQGLGPFVLVFLGESSYVVVRMYWSFSAIRY